MANREYNIIDADGYILEPLDLWANPYNDRMLDHPAYDIL